MWSKLNISLSLHRFVNVIKVLTMNKFAFVGHVAKVSNLFKFTQCGLQNFIYVSKGSSRGVPLYL